MIYFVIQNDEINIVDLHYILNFCSVFLFKKNESTKASCHLIHNRNRH